MTDATKNVVEIRPDDDGGIDEIVAKNCGLHIERMSGNGWFMGIDAADGSYWQFWFGSKRSLVEFRHTEMVPADEMKGRTFGETARKSEDQ